MAAARVPRLGKQPRRRPSRLRDCRRRIRRDDGAPAGILAPADPGHARVRGGGNGDAARTVVLD